MDFRNSRVPASVPARASWQADLPGARVGYRVVVWPPPSAPTSGLESLTTP
jgi:hypothetical protein